MKKIEHEQLKEAIVGSLREHDLDYYFPGFPGVIQCLKILALVIIFAIPKWIYWILMVGFGMYVENRFIHSDFANFVAVACTLVAAVLAYLITNLQLENENCAASSVFTLWRETKLLSLHTELALFFEALVLAPALFVHFRDDAVVYWPGVITTLIVFPLLIYCIGYFTVQSYHEYE